MRSREPDASRPPPGIEDDATPPLESERLEAELAAGEGEAIPSRVLSRVLDEVGRTGGAVNDVDVDTSNAVSRVGSMF